MVNNLANKISLPQDQRYTERAVALRKDVILLAKLGLSNYFTIDVLPHSDPY